MDSTNKRDKDNIKDLTNLIGRALKGQADARQVLRQTHLRLQRIGDTMDWLREEREKLLKQVNAESGDV